MVPPPLLRRIRLTAIALVAALLALAWSTTREASGTVATVPDRAEQTIPFSDVHPYGANFFLEREVNAWDQKQTVELADEAGIRWAKQQFLWSYIEPEPGRYDWTAYDQIVDLYREHDIEVIARLDWPPGWVRKADWVPESYRQRTNAPPADLDDYARFVGEVARHFRGRVRFYQIWNEPNLVAEWGFNPAHPVDPAEYADMLRRAAAAARAADPNAVILSAPLAINNETVDIAGNMSDLDFLRGLYEAGAADDFDILSANAFGMDKPPSEPPAPDVLNFRRAELQREIMVAQGDEDTPVWVNEYGWNAAPADAREMHWQRVTEEQQAQYTVDGVQWGKEHWPWSGVFSIWYFRQWGGLTPDRSVYYFRMVDVDWAKRRVHAAVQAASADLFSATPGYWSERSSPVQLPREAAERDRWVWSWADGASDRNALVSSEPDARLLFRFSGDGVAARLRTGPQAGSVIATLDGRTVSARVGVPAHSLKSDQPDWAWVDLASGLGEGAHVLELTVGATGGEVSVDGFRVSRAPESGPDRSSMTIALGLLSLGLGLLLARDVREAASRVPG